MSALALMMSGFTFRYGNAYDQAGRVAIDTVDGQPGLRFTLTNTAVKLLVIGRKSGPVLVSHETAKFVPLSDLFPDGTPGEVRVRESRPSGSEIEVCSFDLGFIEQADPVAPMAVLEPIEGERNPQTISSGTTG